MKDEDVHNLLGGFAAGILSERERELLFTAALKDQKLFDALADEETLRELLADPVSHRQLLEAIEPVKPGAWERITGLTHRPLYWIVAGSVVAALVVAVVLRREKAPPVEMAKSETRSFEVPPPASPPKPQPSPAPMAVSKPGGRDRGALARGQTSGPPSAGKMKVAVLDFNSPAQPAKDADAGKKASDLLTKDLDSSGYAVIDRKQVDQALQEKNLTARGLDASSAASVGRSVGADTVIFGSVQPAPQAPKAEAAQRAGGVAGLFRAREPLQGAPAPGVAVTATAVNSQTADNLAFASSQSGQSQDGSLAGAVDQVAVSLRQQIQQKSRSKITGTVTGVATKFLTLDVGAKAGLRVGDKLEVRRDSKAIGRVLITSVKDSLSVGEFQGDGGAKAGDTVAGP